MFRRTLTSLYRSAVLLVALPTVLLAQKAPYDVFPDAEPPYYRVRYEASTEPGKLTYPVNYTVWIPQGVKTLRGVVVHQHGCGEGSCRSGLTGAYDLHWQALARKHNCALLAPSYEQPGGADCQMWCDPRNGSDATFQKCLVDLGKKSGHPELAQVPWALWGHSGGGHWAGGMVLLHPERVAAAWLRSGVPLLKPNPDRPSIKAHKLPDAALRVPIMCNPGTKEGVTVKDGRFARVWPANEVFFYTVRGKGGLIGVSVDPLTAHECGNQRYFAIPWLDACLSIRLPKVSGKPLNAMPTDHAWLASPTGFKAVAADKFDGDPLKAAWLPNQSVAQGWMQYVKDTAVADMTPPPAPTNLRISGNKLSWQSQADLESGLARFIIERDGKPVASVPEQGKNRFGRPLFQNLQYSDTPSQPLVPMQFTDKEAEPGQQHTYRVIAVNTVGLKSKPSEKAAAAEKEESEFKKTVYTFKTVDDLKIQADVYRHNDQVKRPVIVWLHGGALIMGNRSGVPKQLQDLAKQHRFVLVSLDYRLAPEAKLHQIIEDLKDGLQWVRKSGPSQFHADPSKLVVAGASAGGYLALMSGIVANPAPSAIVSYWGFGEVDGDWTTKPSAAYRKGKLIAKEDAWADVKGPVITGTNKENGRGRATFFLYLKQTGRWVQAVSDLNPETDRDKLTPFCPIRNLSPSYPTTMMLHGTADRDVPVEQSLDMARELKRHGVGHELIAIEGGGHSLWGGDRKKIAQAFADSMEFIRKQLTDQ